MNSSLHRTTQEVINTQTWIHILAVCWAVASGRGAGGCSECVNNRLGRHGLTHRVDVSEKWKGGKKLSSSSEGWTPWLTAVNVSAAASHKVRSALTTSILTRDHLEAQKMRWSNSGWKQIHSVVFLWNGSLNDFNSQTILLRFFWRSRAQWKRRWCLSPHTFSNKDEEGHLNLVSEW